MLNPTLRLLAHLSATLATAAALTACEIEDDQPLTPDQGQDMPIGQDTAPDTIDEEADLPDASDDMTPDMVEPSLDGLIPADAPVVSKLVGIQRADAVWHVGPSTFIVRQGPTPLAAPAPNLLVLEDKAHTFAAFELVDGAATPLGAPITLKLEANGAVTRDGDALLVATRDAQGATALVPIAVGEGALTRGAALATLPAEVSVESIARYGDVLYAVGTRLDESGKLRRELHNLATSTVLSDERLDALTHVGIVPLAEGVDAPDAAPVLMGRTVDGDVMCALIDDAQTAMRFGELHGGDGAAPHAPDAALIVLGDKKYLGFAVDTREGVKVEAGELILARTVATLVPAVSSQQLDGSRGASSGGVFGGAGVQARGSDYLPAFNKVRRIASHMSSQGKESPTPSSGSAVTIMTLPADGDKTAFKAQPVQGGAGVIVSQLVERADGLVEVTEVSGDRLATYTYDPTREITFAPDGRIKAGASHLLSVAATGRDDARVVVAIERGPLTLEEGDLAGVLTLKEAIFGVVLGINNTKKEPPVLLQSAPIAIDNPIFMPAAGAQENVLARVAAPGPNGTTQAGFFVADVAALRALGDGDALVAGESSGVTLLPPGFVVTQHIGHGEDVYFLGAKDAGGLFSEGRVNASLFHVTVKSKAKGELGVPTEIMSVAKLREELADEAAEFGALKRGDADPTTPVPGLMVMAQGRERSASGRRLYKPLVFTKEFGADSPLQRLGFGDSGVSISGGDLILQDNSAFLLVFSDGSVQKPAHLTFTVEGPKLETLALVDVSPELGALLADNDQLDDLAPSIELDSDNDGIVDLRVLTARPAGASRRDLDSDNDAISDLIERAAPPAGAASGAYNVALRRRGDGYTPILSPDALIYGAIPLAPSGAREARVVADALATTRQR